MYSLESYSKETGLLPTTLRSHRILSKREAGPVYIHKDLSNLLNGFLKTRLKAKGTERLSSHTVVNRMSTEMPVKRTEPGKLLSFHAGEQSQNQASQTKLYL